MEQQFIDHQKWVLKEVYGIDLDELGLPYDIDYFPWPVNEDGIPMNPASMPIFPDEVEKLKSLDPVELITAYAESVKNEQQSKN